MHGKFLRQIPTGNTQVSKEEKKKDNCLYPGVYFLSKKLLMCTIHYSTAIFGMDQNIQFECMDTIASVLYIGT